MFNQQTNSLLVEENRQFAGTGGISANNAQAYFLPAFRDARTGKVEISRFRDGRPAPCHLIDGLPDDWVTDRDPTGRALRLKSSVISGFVRFGQFFTRQEASDFMVGFAS